MNKADVVFVLDAMPQGLTERPLTAIPCWLNYVRSKVPWMFFPTF